MMNNVVTALCKNMKCACVKCVKTLKLEPYVGTTVSSCFSCLHQPNLRSPSYVMIMSVHDWSLSARRECLAFRCMT